MLAMLLMAAVPALAADYSIEDSFNNAVYADAIQVVDQEIEQDQTVSGDVEGGDAEAEAEDNSDATATGGDASVSQDASQSAVQYANDYYYDGYYYDDPYWWGWWW